MKFYELKYINIKKKPSPITKNKINRVELGWIERRRTEEQLLEGTQYSYSNLRMIVMIGDL